MAEPHKRLNKRRWQRTRLIVFARDSYRCTDCGGAGRLECHHVVSLRHDPDQDPYNPSGCATLCRGCHIRITREELIAERRRPEKAAWDRAVAELMQ